MYVDNGTTFKGGNNEIAQMFQENSKFFSNVQTYIQQKGTNWSFIPPRCPHFGGIWEAAVKSFKHHYKRIVGNHILTFEEHSTLACKIEACLNFRPICSIILHESDPIPLTPGHFLIGSEILTRPEPFNEIDLISSFKSRWLLVSALRDNFWKQWKKEALNQLQQRNEWEFPSRNLQIGDIVIIKDELSLPSQWPLAIVTELFKGKDSLVRVVSLRTSGSVKTRRINKLIYLPTDDKYVQTYHSVIN